MPIYDLFSKRGKPLPDVYQYDIVPEKLRNQIIFIWKAALGSPLNGLVHVRHVICREHGLAELVKNARDYQAEVLSFFQHSGHRDILLDIIELSFQVIQSTYYAPEASAGFIEELNYRFKENGVGYHYNAETHQLICIKNQLLHQEVVQPTLHLLTAPAFATANEEYLKAHKHFREGHYDDCLTECCCAFESTLKIILDQKGWPYKQEDTARPLLNAYTAHVSLPSFFNDPLLIIATLRNRLGPHGKGAQPVAVPEHLAAYALHATGAAILLLVEAAK